MTCPPGAHPPCSWLDGWGAALVGAAPGRRAWKVSVALWGCNPCSSIPGASLSEVGGTLGPPDAALLDAKGCTNVHMECVCMWLLLQLCRVCCRAASHPSRFMQRSWAVRCPVHS
jgi:hypothetical protein